MTLTSPRSRLDLPPATPAGGCRGGRAAGTEPGAGVTVSSNVYITGDRFLRDDYDPEADNGDGTTGAGEMTLYLGDLEVTIAYTTSETDADGTPTARTATDTIAARRYTVAGQQTALATSSYQAGSGTGTPAQTIEWTVADRLGSNRARVRTDATDATGLVQELNRHGFCAAPRRVQPLGGGIDRGRSRTRPG